jgi:hypothetical protein
MARPQVPTQVNMLPDATWEVICAIHRDFRIHTRIRAEARAAKKAHEASHRTSTKANV